MNLNALAQSGSEGF